MMKYHIPLLIVLLLCKSVIGEIFTTHTRDSSDYHRAFDVVEIPSDGSFIFCGDVDGENRAVTARFDKYGNNMYYTYHTNVLFHGCTLFQGELYAAGSPCNSDDGVVLFKVDINDGLPRMKKWYKPGSDGCDTSEAYSIIALASSMVIVGTIDINPEFNNDNDALFLSVDGTGGVNFAITLGNEDHDDYVFHDIGQFSNGDFVCVGWGHSSLDKLMYARLDESGNKIYAFLMNDNSYGYGVSVNEDDSFIITGRIGSNGLVMKVNFDGTIAWKKRVYVSQTFSYDEEFYSSVQAYDGNIIAVGFDEEEFNLFVKFDFSNGDIINSTKMSTGTSINAYGSYKIKRSNVTGKGYVFCGKTRIEDPITDRGPCIARIDEDMRSCKTSYSPLQIVVEDDWVASRVTVTYDSRTRFIGFYTKDSVSNDYSSLTHYKFCHGCDDIPAYSPDVCNDGKGICEDSYLCNCTDYDEYFGDYCENAFCFGIPSTNTQNVCSGKGDCGVRDVCSCFSGYYGDVCNITVCAGVFSNLTSLVCGGPSFSTGCWPENHCSCRENYVGMSCEVTWCGNVLSNQSSDVCSGKGACWPYDTCACLAGFGGDICNETTCFGYWNYETDLVCSGRAESCWPNETCNCKAGYYGEICNISRCDGVFSNDTGVCTGHGECIDTDNCTCHAPIYRGKYCEIWSCFGADNDDVDAERICSGHGMCTDFDVCDCLPNYYGIYCNITTCDGIWSNSSDPTICNRRGECSVFQSCDCYDEIPVDPTSHFCECPSEYYGLDCDITTCDGAWSNDTSPENILRMCHSHGSCFVETRTCNCTTANYTGDFCQHWSCGGLDTLDDDVCSGHGDCTKVNHCECEESGVYTGDQCQYWSCFGLSVVDDVDTVCNAHGACIDQDVCACNGQFFSSAYDSPCDIWYCGEFKKDSVHACSSHGRCYTSHLCDCNDLYQGNLCDRFSCGYDFKHPKTCSGHGKCLSPGTCDCKGGYGGNLCNRNIALTAVLVPLLTIGFCLSCLCISIFLCCLCGAGLLISSLVIEILFFFWVYQKAKAARYERLKNFDLLLKEQEIEDDMTVAHLRIDQSLFEISFDDIAIDSRLGEGGSSSVVYRATWLNKIVAFKEKFDSFEKEVEVLASVSHPNIVRFFGATIQTPRIGIVMEFCSNSDLAAFLEKYNSQNPKKWYPLREKIRILGEVCRSMEYLHFRKIIHRDLKLQNVLLDEEEKAKLMDFGLSTIVERMSKVKTSRIGTNLYMAPEVLHDNDYSEKCDVFSFGIFIFIFLTEIWEPYGKETENVQIEVRVSSDPNYRPSLNSFDRVLPPEKNKQIHWIREFMVMCWSHLPENRPSFKTLSEEMLSFVNVVDGGDESTTKYFEDREEGGNDDERGGTMNEKTVVFTMEQLREREEELIKLRTEYLRMKSEM